MKSKLPPIEQEYFDENRELFDAETTATEIKLPLRHQHIFKKTTATMIGCEMCLNEWSDPDGRLWAEIQKQKN